jgi:hypothetical protein
MIAKGFVTNRTCRPLRPVNCFYFLPNVNIPSESVWEWPSASILHKIVSGSQQLIVGVLLERNTHFNTSENDELEIHLHCFDELIVRMRACMHKKMVSLAQKTKSQNRTYQAPDASYVWNSSIIRCLRRYIAQKREKQTCKG